MNSNDRPAGSAPQPGPEASGKRRILVVDDNADNAKTLGMLLKLTGNEPHTAFDAEEAMRLAESLRPRVVLLDIGLPRISGHEVCRWIRAQEWSEGMVLIALTGWSQEEDRQRSAEAGFDAHMVKPIQHQELTRVLNELAPIGG
ncbi:response regulator [Planctomyces sp. SH-PL14]|uniref:response regulator n=1 Tax=Planctomyces sp. SH-PL14 TaxID=1632864 RepID=UPI00078C139A|nr:response regulator [Planctomyces sp. SH-PL14]AMV20092.1 Transcriptional regulatory protein YycF [Planctomyces sp. SH-PL14]